MYETGKESQILPIHQEVNVIKVRGNLELITADQLELIIDGIIRAKQSRLIVDLSDVIYISSAGWGVFISKIKEIREMGGDLKLACMKPDVFEVFRVLEFYMFFKSYETIEKAALAFEQKATA